MTIILLIMQN